MLASLLYPYDSDAPKLIDRWLSELEAERCVIRYKVNGDSYMEICNWLTHQKIDKPSKSKITPFANVREASRDSREDSSGDQRIRGSKDLRIRGSKDQGTPKPPKGDSALSADAFDRFWKAYPSGRKTGKQSARKAFQVAAKTVDTETLVAAAAEYAASPLGQSEYVKGPAAWLNAGCWDDDRAAWQRSGINSKQLPHVIDRIGDES